MRAALCHILILNKNTKSKSQPKHNFGIDSPKLAEHKNFLLQNIMCNGTAIFRFSSAHLYEDISLTLLFLFLWEGPKHTGPKAFFII